MERYSQLRIADYRLNDAVIEIFGGLNSLPFNDWWFDDYDSSVELLNCPVIFSISKEQGEKLNKLGIAKVYVSYEDGTGELFFWANWTRGVSCSPKKSKDPLKRDIYLMVQNGLREAAKTAKVSSDG